MNPGAPQNELALPFSRRSLRTSPSADGRPDLERQRRDFGEHVVAHSFPVKGALGLLSSGSDKPIVGSHPQYFALLAR